MKKKLEQIKLPLKMLKDIVIQLIPGDKFLFFNVFTRNNFICENDTLLLCHQLIRENSSSGLINKDKFKIWDTEYFSNEEGLVSDPTRINWKYFNEINYLSLDMEQVVFLLLRKNILVEDIEEYRNRFRLKKNLFDRINFGNFHQQMGYHLIMNLKINPVEWWIKQKFTDDYSELGNNPYKAVQGNFLKKYFRENVKPEMKIIDIGCGTGFYANWLTELGAEVIGIDPNDQYIKIAKMKTSKKIKYYVKPVGKTSCLDFLESNCADVVFMSDTLLFYFVPLEPKDKPDIKLLLGEIHRILKPSGRFWIIEPHYTFWLAPWLGEGNQPFTILTEYRNRRFLVTPTLSEFINDITLNHFALIAFKEIYADPDIEISDKKSLSFAHEFPLWHFFEFIPQKRHGMTNLLR